MNKKLHRVEIVLYVMAEDVFEACWAATQAPFDVFECTASEAEALDPGWEDAIPYNSDDDCTCAETLRKKKLPSGGWRVTAARTQFGASGSGCPYR